MARRDGRAIGRRCGGFTQVELLTALALLGILAAMGVREYGGYLQRSYDAQAVHDLGSAAAAEQAYFGRTRHYIPIPATRGPITVAPGVAISPSVLLDVTIDGEEFTGTATSSKGTKKVFVYDSATDSIVSK